MGMETSATGPRPTDPGIERQVVAHVASTKGVVQNADVDAHFGLDRVTVGSGAAQDGSSDESVVLSPQAKELLHQAEVQHHVRHGVREAAKSAEKVVEHESKHEEGVKEASEVVQHAHEGQQGVREIHHGIKERVQARAAESPHVGVKAESGALGKDVAKTVPARMTVNSNGANQTGRSTVVLDDGTRITMNSKDASAFGSRLTKVGRVAVPVAGTVAGVAQVVEGARLVKTDPVNGSGKMVTGGTLAGASSSTLIKGAARLAAPLAAVAVGAEGALDVYNGSKNHDREKESVGGAKIIASGLMTTGLVSAQPEVVAAGGVVYAGASLYEHRQTIAKGAKYVANTATSAANTATSAAKDYVNEVFR